MLLIALSVPCVAFNKAVISGLITHLDLCYILIFAGRVEFHGGSPYVGLKSDSQKGSRKEGEDMPDFELGYPSQLRFGYLIGNGKWRQCV